MQKEYRLKRNEEISALVNKRIKVSNQFFTVYYRLTSLYPEKSIRFAVTASKKYGNSPERNYFKRVVREIVRPLLPELIEVCNNLEKGLDLFVVAKLDVKATTYAVKEKELNYLIHKIVGMLSKQS